MKVRLGKTAARITAGQKQSSMESAFIASIASLVNNPHIAYEHAFNKCKRGCGIKNYLFLGTTLHFFFFFKTPSGRLKQVAANRLGALTSGVGVSSKQCKYIRLLKDVNMKTWLSIPRQKSMVPHALSHSVHIKAFITIQSLKACDVHGSQNTHLICAPAFNRNVLKKFQTQKH